MHLPMLSDEELARYARAEFNALTSTPLEQELLRRLEERVADEDTEILVRADEYNITAGGIRQLGEALILDAGNSAALLSAIGDAGFDSPAEIKREFELAQQFRTLANDAGDVFERLKTLTNTATA